MKYEQALAELQSGDVLFWRGNGLISRFIEWWTHSPYSHCGIFWRNGQTPMILDVDEFGFAAQTWAMHPKPVAFIHTHTAWTDEVQNYAVHKYEHVPYGYWAAIWVHLNRLEGLKRPDPFKDLVSMATQMLKARYKKEGGAKST